MLSFLNSANSYANNKLANYQEHDIHGWRVMINKKVVNNNLLYQRLLKQLDQDLNEIADEIPEWALEYLQSTTIWFEKQLPPPFGNRFFFNGSKGLSKKYGIEHTYSGVIAGNTESYLAVANLHPWQMLHELTHAYHQFVNKHDYKPILDAYNNAINKDLHRFGSQYVRRNHKEYFSELTESYFGLNSTYPKNRKELAEHDPVGYCAIVKAWGIVGSQTNNPPLLCN